MGQYDLQDRAAVVTGAGRGLGAAVAAALAEAGARVAVNDIRADAARAVAARIPGALAVPGDAAEPAEVAALFTRAEALGPLDILVANAGVTLTDTVWDTTLDGWERVLRTNLTGPFLCAQEAMRRMRGRGGRIVFMGSVVGHQGALRGHAAYAASKGGLHALARTLARTGAEHGILVNVLAPGIADTEMLRGAHPAGHLDAIAATVPLGLGHADDVAAAAVFLCSDAARHMTGATLDVNGGMLMR